MRWLAVIALALMATQAHAEDLYGTLKKIKDSGRMVIGRSENSVPFSFVDSSGKPIGYSIDICGKIAEGVRQELKMDKLDVQYVTTMGTTLIPLLVNGTIDIGCSPTTHNPTPTNQGAFPPTPSRTAN